MARSVLLALLLIALPAAALSGPSMGVDIPQAFPDASPAVEGSTIVAAPHPAAPESRPPPPGAGDLEFVCAKPTDGRPGFHSGSANALYGCPIRVYDAFVGGNSFSPFGNIQMAVQEDDPMKAAFFSLHGSPASGPTNRSRGGNTHTTFSTPDMGLSWRDSWTSNCPGESQLGEAASGTMDRNGNVTIAYTWSDGTGGIVHVYKMGSVEHDLAYIEQYCSGSEWVIESGSLVTAAHLVTVPLDPDLGPLSPEATVAVWHERGGNGTIRFASSFTAGNSAADWLAAPGGSSIHGCASASNPVAWDGKVWVACETAPGYTGRLAKPGTVDVWSFTPGNGTPSLVSSTGLDGSEPRLAVTTDGYFVATATRLEGEQRVLVPYAMGWHGRQWTPSRDLGTQLHAMLGNLPMRSAHVTALAVLDEGRTAFLVYKEWNRVQEDPLGRLPQPPDPNDPSAPRLADFQKVVVTFDECTAPVKASAFNLGTTPEVYNQAGITDRPGLFDDLFDGLQVVRMPEGEEWVFFAVNDYGAAQFGAIRGRTGVSGDVCFYAPPLPTPPIPAVPQALAVGNPANAVVGAVVGTAAAAMVLYLLAVRRRAPTAVAAEDK